MRFRSFLCFFLRIFLRRFLTTEGKPRSLSVLIGSEEVPEVDRFAQWSLQTDRPQLRAFGGVCHRRDQPKTAVVGHVFEVADPGEAAVAVGEADQQPVELREIEQRRSAA